MQSHRSRAEERQIMNPIALADAVVSSLVKQ